MSPGNAFCSSTMGVKIIGMTNPTWTSMPLRWGAARCLPMLCKAELSWPQHLLQHLLQALHRLKKGKWLPVFHTNFLPLCRVLINLSLTLDFKTFASFLLLCNYSPRQIWLNWLSKGPPTVFWSCPHLNSSLSALTYWCNANGCSAFGGVMVTDTCHNNADIFHARKPPRILWFTEVPQIATTPELSLLQRTFSHQDIKATAISNLPNSQSRGQHEEKTGQGIWAYSSLKYVKLSSSLQKLLLPEPPSSVCITAWAGL